jgi:hypothetical protein
MSDSRVLFTGDYWHEEFQAIVANFPVAATLVPLDRLDGLSDDQTHDLIVLAQARPSQIPTEAVEALQRRYPTTPIVALLGSWCEGGMRTDVAWPGVRRIYWHQWSGRFDRFTSQLTNEGITLWHQPPTATNVDDALADRETSESDCDLLIGVSAIDQVQFETVRDAVAMFDWHACWIERSSLQESTIDEISAVCIDGNSISDDLSGRIVGIKDQLPNVPLTLVLNFPRMQEVQAAHELGVAEIVSKPFKAEDLKFAIERSIAGANASRTVPRPHAWNAKKRTADGSSNR